MARPLRIFYRGAFFTSPAAVMNENNIFQDDRDRLKKALEEAEAVGKRRDRDDPMFRGHLT